MVNPPGNSERPTFFQHLKQVCTQLINQIKTIIIKTFTVNKEPLDPSITLSNKKVSWLSTSQLNKEIKDQKELRTALAISHMVQALLPTTQKTSGIRTPDELQQAQKQRVRLESLRKDFHINLEDIPQLPLGQPSNSPLRSHQALRQASQTRQQSLRARLERGKAAFEALAMRTLSSLNDMFKQALDSEHSKDLFLYLYKANPEKFNQILGSIFHEEGRTLTDQHLILHALPQEALSSFISSLPQDDLTTYLHNLSASNRAVHPRLPDGLTAALNSKFETDFSRLITTKDMVSLITKSSEHDREIALLFTHLPYNQQEALLQQIQPNPSFATHTATCLLNHCPKEERPALEARLLEKLFPDVHLPQAESYHSLMSLQEETTLITLYGKLKPFSHIRQQFMNQLKGSGTQPMFTHLDELGQKLSLTPLISNAAFDDQTLELSPKMKPVAIKTLLEKIYRAQGSRFTQDNEEAIEALLPKYKHFTQQIAQEIVDASQFKTDVEKARDTIKRAVDTLDILLLDTLPSDFPFKSEISQAAGRIAQELDKRRQQARRLIKEAIQTGNLGLLTTLDSIMKEELKTEIEAAPIQSHIRKMDHKIFSDLESETPNLSNISQMTSQELIEGLDHLQCHHSHAQQAKFACQDQLDLLEFLDGNLKGQPLINACFKDNHFNERLVTQLSHSTLIDLKKNIQTRLSMRDLAKLNEIIEAKKPS